MTSTMTHNTQAKKQLKMAFDRHHILGTLFILIAIVMVAQGLWLAHQRDAEAQCQADYNQKTSIVVAQRAQWADEDRAALNQMIYTVINPKVTQTQAQEAVQSYATTARKNEANRQANPLPTRTSCN